MSNNIVLRKSTPSSNKRSFRQSEGLKMNQSGLVHFIRKPWSGMRFNKISGTKEKFHGRNKEGHGLVLVNDHLFCTLCNVPVSKVAQHLSTAKHQKAYSSRIERSNKNSDMHPTLISNVAVSSRNKEASSDSNDECINATCTYEKFIQMHSLKAQYAEFLLTLDASGKGNTFFHYFI